LRHNPGDVIDGRLRPIKLGNLAIDFQHASPSRLYWAGRPAMRFVQALHWIRDMLPSDDGGIQQRLLKILNDPDYGMTIQKDLQDGCMRFQTGCVSSYGICFARQWSTPNSLST
jgi:hypothetical protein